MIASAVHCDHATVARVLNRYQPVADALRQAKRDHLLGIWQWTYLRAAALADDLVALGATTRQEHGQTAAAMRNYATVMGIATDKVQILTGMPTAILAGVLEHRLALPQLAARLARVANALPSGVLPATTDGVAAAPTHD